MRVTYVIGLPGGGPVSHLLELAPRVAALGAQVRVLAGSEHVCAAFRAIGLDAEVMPLRRSLDLGAAAAAFRRAAATDVVHTHDRRAGLLVRPPARARGAAVVHTFHGLPQELAPLLGRPEGSLAPDARGLRKLWLWHGYFKLEAALARLGTVVAPSHAMAAFLVARGLPGSRIRVLPSGVEVRRTEPSPRGEAPLAVATACALHRYKGVDALLRACARTAGPLHLDVYGDGEERPALERLARELDVAATFHGWRDDVPARLEAADVFVLPSQAENLPITILEAMAVAVPVIGTRVGGVPELVEDGATGLLVEPGDATSIAAALDRLAGDEELRRAFGRAGAQKARAEYAAADVARRLVSLYEELAGPR